MSPEGHDEAEDLCQTSNLDKAGNANDSQRSKAYHEHDFEDLNMLLNDFAYIPLQRQKFLQKLLVKGQRYLSGVCG